MPDRHPRDMVTVRKLLFLKHGHLASWPERFAAWPPLNKGCRARWRCATVQRAQGGLSARVGYSLEKRLLGTLGNCLHEVSWEQSLQPAWWIETVLGEREKGPRGWGMVAMSSSQGAGMGCDSPGCLAMQVGALKVSDALMETSLTGRKSQCLRTSWGYSSILGSVLYSSWQTGSSPGILPTPHIPTLGLSPPNALSPQSLPFFFFKSNLFGVGRWDMRIYHK